MKMFHDNVGREWAITINVTTLKRCRSLTNFDPLSIVESRESLARLAADPVLLGDILFALVKPQADERKITDLDFGTALAGDAIERATTALMEELVDFFPQSRREILTLAASKQRELSALVERRVLDRLVSEMDAISSRAESILDRLLDEAFEPGNSSSASLASADSIPPS